MHSTRSKTVTIRQSFNASGTRSLRTRLQINSALVGAALTLAAPSLALASNECGAAVGGVVTCAATGSPYAGGISYSASGQGLTVNLESGALVHSTASVSAGVDLQSNDENITLNHGGGVIADRGYGVSLQTSTGFITANLGEVVSATSAGVYAFHDDGGGLINVRKVTSGAEGVVANSYNGGFTINAGSILAVGVGIDAFSVGSGNLVVTSTDRIETTGVGSSGLTAATSGDILIDVNAVRTAGRNSIGIQSSTDLGRLDVSAKSIVTVGANSFGLQAIGQGGLVKVDAGSISTQGNGGVGLQARNNSGDAFVHAGAVDTRGDNAAAVDAQNIFGGIVVKIDGAISTAGTGSNGVNGVNANGDIALTSAGTVSTLGANSIGVNLSNGRGAVTADVATVSTRGAATAAVMAVADAGRVTVKALDVVASGALSEGVLARSNSGPVSVAVRNSAADAAAIHAIGVAGPADVAISGTVRSANSDAIVVQSGAAASITIAAAGSVTGAGGAIVLNALNATINTAGSLSGGASPTIVATQGPVTLTNSGKFVGGVRFGAGANLVANSGDFALSGVSDFGGGASRLVNTGVVRMLAPSALSGLRRFENAGLVTLADNHAGDVLRISGDYVGVNGRLALDVNALAGGGATHDQLVIGGAASGVTSISLNHVGGVALTPGTTLKLVDAGGGSQAGAFTLAPGSSEVGFAHYGLRYEAAGDDFYLVATEGAAVFQALKINEGAQTLWRQSADAWSAHAASLRDPAAGGSPARRVWGQVYGSTDKRDQTLVRAAGGMVQTVDLSYRQEHVGGQIGVDLGAAAAAPGVTFGLTGGYLDSALKFAGTADRADYKSVNLGAYALGRQGRYFVDALAKYDLFQVKTRSATAGYAETLDGSTFGVQAEAGARIGSAGFFVEPVASLAYSRTDLDTLRALGATLDFEVLNGLRGKLGARVGGSRPLAGGVAAYYLGAHVVKEFDGEGGVRFIQGQAASVLANDPLKSYGQFQAGASFASTAGLTGFVEGAAGSSDRYENYSGRIGLRMVF